MQHLLECCGRCDQVVLKDTLVQDADERVCDSCAPGTAFSLSAEDKALLDELIDCELPLAHDWNNQCPPPSARAMGEHVVIPEEIWASTQNLLLDIKRVLRNA